MVVKGPDIVLVDGRTALQLFVKLRKPQSRFHHANPERQAHIHSKFESTHEYVKAYVVPSSFCHCR